jgi:peptidoglycan-N-acetylglucosamine deacetylase
MVWHTVPRPVQLFFPKRIWSGEASGNQVYLTFDDGPVPCVTDFVLNELAKRNQQATFFMVGDNLRKFPSLGKGVLESGHAIGNHTHNHLNGWETEHLAYLKNIRTCDQVLDSLLGIQTDLFRPPYGLIRSSQAENILNTKKLVMWNVLSGDYAKTIPPSRVLEKSINHTRAGSIILFHDQLKTKDVICQILPRYLDFLMENGFQTSLLK